MRATKELREKIEKEKQRKFDIKQELAKFHKAKVKPREAEVEAKIDVLDYFNSLSDSQKKDFAKETQLKEISDSFPKYLKYVYGDYYRMTKFHSRLAMIGDKIVKDIEQGKNIIVCISVPPQAGKGYPIDFPILTTKGWKNHGDLEVGDYVYNDKGEQVMVLGNQKPYMHECVRVKFASGEEHIVTKEHLWKVLLEEENRRHRWEKHTRVRKEYILEAQELMNILPKSRRSPAIAMNEPLYNDEKELPIDPYVLGLWLGDGISANNLIVVGDSDLANELANIGDREEYSVIKREHNPSVSYIKLGKVVNREHKNDYKNEFTKRLANLGLKNNKHIPTEYLLASESQRWELLKGLMDTDGSVMKYRGTCEYCGVNKELCENVLTLLRSLGIKANLREGNATINGRFISKKYRVSFIPNKGQVIFGLKRKQDRIDNKGTKDRGDKFRYFITSIEPVGERLVSCISVEGGMYLAGKGLIPTHNSTTLTESLPSYFLGRNPNEGVIVCSYNADFAEKFGDSNRQKLRKYGKDLFGVEISDSMDTKTKFMFEGYHGQMVSTGIFGEITGNKASLIIIDDPFKSNLESESKVYRDKVYDIVKQSCETRLRPKGSALVIIHTRWHEDDLIGRYSKEEGVIYINIPCVWDSSFGDKDTLLGRKVGEVFCPELGYTSEWAEKKRKSLGNRSFNALYQGKPYVDGGNIVTRDKLRFYDKAELPTEFDEITLSADLSLGGTSADSDPTCISVWGRKGANHYLIKVINKKMGFTEQQNSINRLCADYPTIQRKIVERKANGQALIETLNKNISGIIPYDPKGTSKVSRLEAVTSYFEAGNIWFPNEKVMPNVEEFVEQLLKFPACAHDDFVDTLSQYLLNYECKGQGKIVNDSTMVLLSKAIRGFGL